MVTPTTIASWMKRLEDQDDSLVQLSEPVNKFPDFVRYAVQRLKTVCPSLGKVKIAEILSRAGLHLAKTTVGRILKEDPLDDPDNAESEETIVVDDSVATQESKATEERIVTAKYMNHVWHVDLTAVSILGGFWATWLPFALGAVLAILLVGCGRDGSSFATMHGRDDLH